MASALARLASAARQVTRALSGGPRRRNYGKRSSVSDAAILLARSLGSFARRRTGGGLAGLASRARSGRIDRRLPEQVNIPIGSGPTPPPIDPRHFLGQLERLARGESIDPAVAAEIEKTLAGEGGPPPPPPVGTTTPEAGTGAEDFDDIETLGRDLGYNRDDFAELQEGQIHVASSNVYSYFYQAESKYSGIVYVTFLAPAPKGQPRTGPGPTYAYYDVTRGKFWRFQKDTEESAGGAVWDHLRVRGTLWNHQHRYRLIHVSGEYVPRRATFRGFRTRYLRPIGGVGDKGTAGRGDLRQLGPTKKSSELRRRGFKRSTLPEKLFDSGPDRGEPDRGRPNRGR